MSVGSASSSPSNSARFWAFQAKIALVGYLWLGYTDRSAREPDLEPDGWEHRVPLAKVVDYERYQARWTGAIRGETSRRNTRS